MAISLGIYLGKFHVFVSFLYVKVNIKLFDNWFETGGTIEIFPRGHHIKKSVYIDGARSVRDYMFAMPVSSVKFVKISCLENFRLYGNSVPLTAERCYSTLTHLCISAIVLK